MVLRGKLSSIMRTLRNFIQSVEIKKSAGNDANISSSLA